MLEVHSPSVLVLIALLKFGLQLADLLRGLPDPVHGDGEGLRQVGLDLDAAQAEVLGEPHRAQRELGAVQHPVWGEDILNF